MDIDFAPTFDQGVYTRALPKPLIWWAIALFTWLIFGFLDASEGANGDSLVELSARSGIAIEVLILFGAWGGLIVIKEGGNAGDGFIAGILLGFGAWLIWWILFGLINGTENADFAQDHLSKLWVFMFYHSIGAGTFAGIMETQNRY